ncbi:MAG: hypothetical protein AB4368_14040 [Xenococcaceae cyanobacterium]
MLNINPTSFVANNSSLRAFDINGLLHPVQPIEQVILLTLSNLEANKYHKFYLDDKLNCALNLIYYWIEVPTDDAIERLQITARPDLKLYIFESAKVSRVKAFSEFSGSTNLLLENHKEYEFYTNLQVDHLNFVCQPVHLLEKIELSTTLVSRETNVRVSS